MIVTTVIRARSSAWLERQAHKSVMLRDLLAGRSNRPGPTTQIVIRYLQVFAISYSSLHTIAISVKQGFSEYLLFR